MQVLQKTVQFIQETVLQVQNINVEEEKKKKKNEENEEEKKEEDEKKKKNTRATMIQKAVYNKG